jgi:hypothetical protein
MAPDYFLHLFLSFSSLNNNKIDTMKVVDKINKAQNEGRTYYSFEYFPPKTEMVNRDVVNQKNSCMITIGNLGCPKFI